MGANDELLKQFGAVEIPTPDSTSKNDALLKQFGAQDIAAEGLPLPRRQYGAFEALYEAPFSAPGDVVKQGKALWEAVNNAVCLTLLPGHCAKPHQNRYATLLTT
jgi:hypothetical protein